MADKIEADVQGTGTRVASLTGHVSSVGKQDVRRLVALDLAVLSMYKGEAGDSIVNRARLFELYLQGDRQA